MFRVFYLGEHPGSRGVCMYEGTLDKCVGFVRRQDPEYVSPDRGFLIVDEKERIVLQTGEDPDDLFEPRGVFFLKNYCTG